MSVIFGQRLLRIVLDGKSESLGSWFCSRKRQCNGTKGDTRTDKVCWHKCMDDAEIYAQEGSEQGGEVLI